MKELLLIKENEEETELEKQLEEHDLEFKVQIGGKGKHVRVFPSVSIMEDGEQLEIFEEYDESIPLQLENPELISTKKRKKLAWDNAKTTADKLNLIAEKLGLKEGEQK